MISEEKDDMFGAMPGVEADSTPSVQSETDSVDAVVPDGKVMVIGIGGSGAKTVTALSALPEARWIQTAVIDTDKDSLDECVSRNILRAEADWTLRNGIGCGGDIIKGERAIARERSKINALLEGVSMLIVTGGLGGGTATGGMRTIASVARNASIPTVFMPTTPFAFEAYSRRKNAEDCISELLPIADVLITLPNDLLFSKLPSTAPVEEAFSLACGEMAHTILGVAEILRCRNLFGTDYASFMTVLRGRRSSCGTGVGTAGSDDGLDRCHIALGRMLESPFLGGVTRLESSDAVILTLTGGTDLQTGEMSRALETASAMIPKGANLIVGVNTNPAFNGRVQMSAIAIRYDQTIDTMMPAHTPSETLWSVTQPPPQKQRQSPQTSGEKASPKQLEFNLPSYSKGIFANLAPVKYRDEDLDIPTFQRRGVVIDKGNDER